MTIEEIFDSMLNSAVENQSNNEHFMQENHDSMDTSIVAMTDGVSAAIHSNAEVIPMVTDSDIDSSLTELVARHSGTRTGLLQIATGAISEP